MIGWSRDIDEQAWSSWEPPSADAPDPERLREQLARRIWRDDEQRSRLVAVRIGRRRQSRGGMTALYTLVFNGCGDKDVEQVYVGYEPSSESLDREYQAAVEVATIQPPIGRAVVQIPDANLLLTAFPNDRRLRVADEDALRACLLRVAARLARRRSRRRPICQLKDATFTMLRYAPSQRVTVRCAGVFAFDEGTELPFSFIAKQFRKPDIARSIHRSLTALDRFFSGSPVVRLPRPARFDAETGLVLMEDLPGLDLISALPRIDLGETMASAGQMLAAFHQSPRVVRKRISVRAKMTEVREVASKIERFFPQALPRLNACSARCLRIHWTDDVPPVLLHGAFRPKHVLVHQGRLAMIDVDGMCVGHPAHDLGHFLSALYYLEAQRLLTPADRRLSVRRFLEGYSSHAPWQLPPAAVLWCTAAVLVHKQARKFVVHLHKDRCEKVESVLALAEKTLTACERLPPGAPLAVVETVLC
jgi:phosphotransferase family enzyme